MAKDIDFVWPLLQQHQGKTFYTAKGLPFTYTIRGGELFVDRRSKSTQFPPWRMHWKKLLRWKWTVSPSLGRRKSAAMGQAISIRYCWRWGFLPFPTAVKM